MASLRTVVAQYWIAGNSGYPEWVRLSERICRAYCSLHKYDYRISYKNYYPRRRFAWSKLPFIKHLLTEYDRVLFVDPDAFFQTPEITVENVVDMTHELVGCNEHGMIIAADTVLEQNRYNASVCNAGVFIVDNNQQGRDIIDGWINAGDNFTFYHNHSAYEQLCFNDCVLGRYPGLIFLKDYYLLQGRCSHFIRHYSGTGHHKLLDIMTRAAREVWHI